MINSKSKDKESLLGRASGLNEKDTVYIHSVFFWSHNIFLCLPKSPLDLTAETVGGLGHILLLSLLPFLYPPHKRRSYSFIPDGC